MSDALRLIWPPAYVDLRTQKDIDALAEKVWRQRVKTNEENRAKARALAEEKAK